MTKEMSVEEKKELARKAKEEAKEKAKADKEKKEADANAEKTAAKQQKINEAITTAGQTFTALTENRTAIAGIVESLTAESTVEQVQTVIDQTAEGVKSSKVLLKEIKTLARKFKDSNELAQAVTAAEGELKAIDELVAPLKGKVTEAKAAAKQAEKEAKRLEREKAKEANAMPKQNDVTRPRPDTACGKAWAMFDRLSEKLKQPVPIAIALQASEKEGLVFDTVKTQYARWKKFNGIEGRVPMPLPEGLLE